MAIRLRSEFTDWHGIDWKIDISDSDYFGSVATFVTIANNGGIEFSRTMQDGDQPFFSPLITTSVNIYMSTEVNGAANADVNSFVAALPNGKENQFQCVIYRNNVRYFIGMILTDGVSYVDEAPTTITIQATDGLMRLEQIPFTFATTAPNPQYPLGRYIQEALKFCAFESYFTNTETYIRSTISWRANEQRNLNDVLTDARLPKNTFIDDEETGEPVNCLDAIRIVLKAVGANIRFEEGSWFISQFSNLAYTNVATYDYSKTTNWGVSDAYLGVYNPSYTVPTSPVRAISAGLNHAWRPLVRYCRVNWQVNSKLVFSKYQKSVTNFDTAYAKQFITGNTSDIANIQNGLTKCTVKIDFINQLTIIYVGNTRIPSWDTAGVAINLTISLDNTWYLTKVNNQFIWVKDNTKFVQYIQTVNVENYVVAGNVDASFIIPAPPAPASGRYDVLNVVAYPALQNGWQRNDNMYFYGSITLAQMVGDETQDKGDVTFQSENNTTNAASIEVEEEIKAGTIDVDWCNGKIEVYTGAAWVGATKFIDKLETSPTAEYLPQMLAVKTIEYQRQPRETLEGEMVMNNYNTTKCLVYDSRRWAFLEGTYRVTDGAWEGTWVEVLRQSTGFTNNNALPFRDKLRKYADGLGRVGDVAAGHDKQISDLYQQVDTIKKDLEQMRNYLNTGVDGYLLQFINGLPTTAENGANYTLVAKAGTGSSAPFTLEWKAP